MSSPLEILDQQDAKRAEELKKLSQTHCYDHTLCGEDCLPDCPHYAEKKSEEKSKPAYTKGPYGIQISETNKRFWVGWVKKDDSGKPRVVNVIYTDSWNRRMEGAKERYLADAERVVACLNACAGITTEALNKGIVKGCIEGMHRYNHNMDKIANWMGVPVYEEESN